MEYDYANIDELKTKNPWKSATVDTKVLDVDEIVYKDPSLQRGWGWDRQDEIQKKKYKKEIQFPLPINGNFHKAKYLLLYSNPATEKEDISNVKNELLKCFKLDHDAKFVIANEDWNKFYTKELARFFRHEYKDNSEISKDKEEMTKFLQDFCFVNYCAYATGVNEFDFTEAQINSKSKNKVSLKDMESTKFIIALVKYWIKTNGRENIFIVRVRDKVWKNHLFAKLDFKTMYTKNV